MKKSYVFIIKGILIATAIFLLVGVGEAIGDRPVMLGTDTYGAEETGVRNIVGVRNILQNVVGWIQVFFYIVATLMIILAAWDYATHGDNEEKVKSARDKVIYALVAIAIAVIAGGVIALVRNFI